MTVNRKRKIKVAVFLLICQFFTIAPGSMCLAMGEKNEAGSNMEGVTEDIKEYEIKVEEIDLGEYETTMMVGSRQLLMVTVLPTTVTEQNITYQSSNEQVASINGMGRITALAVGTTEISAICQDITEQFTLTVSEGETEKEITVTDIELSDYEEELDVDKTLTLSATVLPAEASDMRVVFTSSDNNIATVSSTGEVKGIAPGQVTITMQAGGISKNIVLTVKVTTTAIDLNSTYVVLKSGEYYQLSGKVLPQEANQGLTFQSLDSNIATVSENGNITAKAIGNTTVIVSNGEMSNAVTVIVNARSVNESDVPEVIKQKDEIDLTKEDAKLIELIEKKDQVKITVNEYDMITSSVLKTLYTSGKMLCIKGDGYTMKLSGKDIVNYQNELYTNIKPKDTKHGVKFTLNRGQNLPGQVIIELKDSNSYNHIYLYNEKKEKYEKIKGNKLSEIDLNIAGTYLATAEKIGSFTIHISFLIGAVMILLVLVVVYIVIKRKYWFW